MTNQPLLRIISAMLQHMSIDEFEGIQFEIEYVVQDGDNYSVRGCFQSINVEMILILFQTSK